MKLSLCLLLCSVVLASVPLALCHEREELDRCTQQCQSHEGDMYEYLACEKRCQLQQREREGRGRESERDPQRRYEECKQRCEREERGGQREPRKQCEQKCEWQREQDEREQQERGRGGRGHNAQDPRKQFEECSRECQQHEQSQQRRCQQQCEDQYRRQQREREREREEINPRKWEEEEEEQRDNPYHFHQRRFQSRFSSEEGQIRVLENFVQKSELLRGIKNYRVAILEARPNTFLIPHHCDADTIIFVVKGKGTISFVWQDKKETKKESYNLECGNVFRISSGTTVYLINNGQNEDLQIVKLVQPVNNPGEFKEYFAAGGENPQSYYSVFSNDVLEAALNTPSDQLERFFKQHGRRQGAIVRASEEQIKALSQHVSSQRQAGRGKRGPINLKNERPLYTNKFGKFFEANPEEFQQLRDVDITVSFSDINQGAMMVPHYNSRSTFVVFVADGNGRVEMACPHLSSSKRREYRGREELPFTRREREDEEQTSGRFHKVTANLSPGDVFVIPAGHPVAIIASENQNLRLVGFGINGQDNQRNFLAGKDNIMNEVDREAIELSFNVKGREADQIFKNQKESFFTEGPGRAGRGERREETKGLPLSSILNTAAFF